MKNVKKLIPGAAIALVIAAAAKFLESLEESAFLPTIPKFLSDEKDEGQGARRGTAYHLSLIHI